MYFLRLGPRVDLVERTQARTFAMAIPGTIIKAAEHLRDIAQGIFLHVPYIHFQDFLPDIPGFPPRTVTWIVAALATVGLLFFVFHPGRRESSVFLAWLFVALLPGLFSDRAFPKRVSTLYPELAILAGLTASWFLAEWRRCFGPRSTAFVGMVVALLFGTWLTVAARLWLSGYWGSIGVPPEVQATREIAARLEPRSIVIVDIREPWLHGKLTYLMLDELDSPQHRPVVWYIRDPRYRSWEELVTNPGLAINEVTARQSTLGWTRYSRRFDEIRSVRHWERVVFVVHAAESGDERTQLVKAMCPQATVSPKRFGGSLGAHYDIIECAREVDIR